MAVNKKRVRINSITIESYRGIDKLTVSFPRGNMPDDNDINVIGSKNGVGKSSVLECCAWAMLAASYPHEIFEYRGFDFVDLVKSGANVAVIKADLLVSGKKEIVTIKFDTKGRVSFEGFAQGVGEKRSTDSLRLLEGVLGLYPDPVMAKNLLFLHSYRKVQEGRPEFGMLIDDDDVARYRRRAHYPRISYSAYDGYTPSFSLFKQLIIRNMMEGADLFEASSQQSVNRRNESIRVLNDLLETYAAVHIGKLRPYKNNTIDVNVERIDEPGNGFSIDGLSSGQKEAISTLFMIWNATYESQSVVLIDEPELHLNIEWHSGFVRKLLEIAPDNQYILATHAEDIMASVDSDFRHLLIADKNI